MTVPAAVPGEFTWYYDKPVPYSLTVLAEADLAGTEPEAGAA